MHKILGPRATHRPHACTATLWTPGLERLLVQSGFQDSGQPSTLDRVPTRAEPVLIRIPILRHNRGDPFRMLHGQPEPYRGTVVEDIERVAAEAELCP